MSIFKRHNVNRDIDNKVSYKPATCLPQTNDRQFIDDVIAAHNKRRRDHGVPGLRHNSELTKVAQKWAEQLSRSNCFQHSHASLKGEKMGENLAMKWSSQTDYSYTGDDAVEQWYSEIRMYTFGVEPSNLSQVGHFTQLVWLATREVGVGRAKGRDGKTIVVANYLPAGNGIGRFTANVPRKGARPSANETSQKTPLISTQTRPALSPNNNSAQSFHVFPVTNPNTNSNFTSTPSGNVTNYKHSPVSSIKTTPKSTAQNAQPYTASSKNFTRNNNSSPFQPYNLNVSKTDIFSKSIKPVEINRLNMSKVSTSTRTSTRTEGSGANAVTKTMVEETVTYSDGRKEVNTKETITKGEAGITPQMKNMSLSDSQHQGQRKAEGKPVKAQSMSEFRAESLKVHNAHRVSHAAPPLKTARDLDDYAQKWAESLAAAGKFEHSNCTMKDGTQLGENIACKWSSGGADYSGKEVVDYWYSEVSKHDFKSARFSSGSGHFTQVVWKATKEVGMGKAVARDGKVIVVGSYRPAGNLQGAFLENVTPAKK